MANNMATDTDMEKYVVTFLMRGQRIKNFIMAENTEEALDFFYYSHDDPTIRVLSVEKE